jgi:serine/threonine-protein kinase
VDARSDLYALGAVAYLLLTGTVLFSGDSAVAVCAKHLHSPPESPSARLGQALPADLEAIVLACLAKVPGSRPDSARALRNALERCADAGSWRPEDAEAWWQRYDSSIEARRRSRTASMRPTSVAVDLSRTQEAASNTLRVPV